MRHKTSRRHRRSTCLPASRRRQCLPRPLPASATMPVRLWQPISGQRSPCTMPVRHNSWITPPRYDAIAAEISGLSPTWVSPQSGRCHRTATCLPTGRRQERGNVAAKHDVSVAIRKEPYDATSARSTIRKQFVTLDPSTSLPLFYPCGGNITATIIKLRAKKPKAAATPPNSLLRPPRRYNCTNASLSSTNVRITLATTIAT